MRFADSGTARNKHVSFRQDRARNKRTRSEPDGAATDDAAVHAGALLDHGVLVTLGGSEKARARAEVECAGGDYIGIEGLAGRENEITLDAKALARRRECIALIRRGVRNVAGILGLADVEL